jgi:hypothetical protein
MQCKDTNFWYKCFSMQSVKQSQPFKTYGHTALLPWRQSPATCSALKKILKASDALVIAEKEEVENLPREC